MNVPDNACNELGSNTDEYDSDTVQSDITFDINIEQFADQFKVEIKEGKKRNYKALNSG